MAILAEELVEEWLNRQGYFTIRGVKLGVDEIDLLAVGFDGRGKPVCRHIEVQVSMRPVGYISRIPKEHLKLGQSKSSAKTRPSDVLKKGVCEWIDKKFKKPKKEDALKAIFPRNTKWTSEFVVNNVKSEEEVELIEKAGVRIIRFRQIISELNEGRTEKGDFKINRAAGGDFAELIQFSSRTL